MRDISDHLQDTFSSFGEVRVRRMFGGYGVFRDGVMFALVADDALYLKADDEIRGHFESLNLPRFSYDKQGKAISMSYFLAPDVIYDDPVEAAVWADRSFRAALRSRTGRG